MLLLSNKVTDVPVMSLRTGGKVAIATEPIINPNNLRVEGWYCSDVFSKETLILLAKDVRDFVPQGFAINDHEDLANPEDLIRLKDVMELDFRLIGKPVVTDRKRRLGKISDYAIESDNLHVQKLYVARNVLKSFTTGHLSVDRSQIVEITNRRVVVRDVDVKATSRRVVTSVAAG